MAVCFGSARAGATVTGVLLAAVFAAMAGCGGDSATCNCPDAACDTCGCTDAAVDSTADLPNQDVGQDVRSGDAGDAGEDNAGDANVDDSGDNGDSSDPGPVEPTYWTAESTKTIDTDEFVLVNGQRFFALGMHASPGRQYDGITGPGECNPDTGLGYIDINITKTRQAAAAGANFVYLWGYNDRTRDMLNVTPRFHGLYHDGYGTRLPVEDDVVPIIYNAFGESDMDGYSEERVSNMRSTFEEFIARTGAFSTENMPNLPAVEQVGHMSWHPTFRMKGGGDGTGEVLTDEQVRAFATTTNMMIGDAYAYVENRYDMSDPGQAIIGMFSGQKGDIGEGYDYWIETDDPDHRSYFDSGFTLAESLTRQRDPGTVVWMWLQGYAFGNSIREDACKGEESDSWATGGFPPLPYLIKETLSVIAAGATGIVFFGYPSTQSNEAEIIHTIFRGLSHPEVYGPALLSPRLDLGVDTLFAGQEGYDGKGRAHMAVKWDETGRRAYIIGSNPGARATTVELDFPWTVAKVEVLDWRFPRFTETTRVEIRDRRLVWTFNRDEGMLIRVTPLEKPEE